MRARAAIAAACIVLGCREAPTELVVSISSDIRSLERVRLVLRRDGDATPFHDTWYALRGGRFTLPGEVTVRAVDPTDARALHIDVTADASGDALDYSLSMTAHFRPQRTTWVDVYLPDRCTDPLARMCPLGQVCGLVQCEPAERTPLDTAPGHDGGLDAPAGDAGPDAADGVDAGDVIDASDAGDVFDASDAADAGDAADVSDAGDAADVGDAADLGDAADVSDVSEAAVDVARMLCADGGVPGPERCYNGLDENCDGRADEGCAQQSCPDDAGVVGCGEHVVAVLAPPVEIGDVAALGASPPRLVRPDSFLMDRYEVTVERFRRYWDAGHPVPVGGRVVYPGGVEIVLSPWVANSATLAGNPRDPSGFPLCTMDGGVPAGTPVTCVDWATAMAFCVWDGGRLPTEAEWEYGARYTLVSSGAGGALTPGRVFPWGNDAPLCQANFVEQDPMCPGHVTHVWPVGTNQPDWYPFYDLAGNVSEWTADLFGVYGVAPCWDGEAVRYNPLCRGVAGSQRVLRGGSFSSRVIGVRAASRDHSGADRHASGIGFRCVRVPL